MFRKIVANLPFSPALVGQLGFYAKRLRKEETTRRAGLIVTALALVVQSFAVFSPPEAANASSTADFVPGGVTNKQQMLSHFDKNTGKIASVMKSLGITRAELANANKQTIGEKGYFNWSRTSLYSHAQGQRSWDYGGGVVYYRPMTLTAGASTRHDVLVGHSAIFGWFAIKMDCGNLVTNKPPQAPNPKVVCENLQVKKIAPTKFQLKAVASTADGAKINGYQFAITHQGKTVTQKSNDATINFERDDPGTYKAKVTLLSSLGEKSSANCATSFDVNTKANCEAATATALSRTSFKVSGQVEATKGVTIKSYTYTFYNKSGKLIDTKKFSSTAKSHSFTYNQETSGVYTVKLSVATSIDTVSGGNCQAAFTVTPPPTPVAECVNVSANIVNRNVVTLTGSSQTSNGATVSEYVFVIKNKDGKVTKTLPVTSKELTATAKSFELDPGAYTVELTVKTSLGNKTNTDNCVANFDIKPKDVCQYNPELEPNDPDCQPCPDNPDIWIKDEKCAAEIINTKTAKNVTQGGIDATTKVAKSGDKITYTISTENKGYAPQTLSMKESLGDVLEYATIVDNGGGDFNQDDKTLTWPAVKINPGTKETRTFMVQIMDKIPETNTGRSNEDSYDCKLVNTYGNNTEVTVECPVAKQIVEQVVSELPTTGPGENMAFAGIILAIVAYFYARSRQLGKEVRLIRRNVHAGAI